MRRHASAAPAASDRSQARGLGTFIRGALTTRGHSRRADGSGAPEERVFALPARLPRQLALPLVPLAAVLLLAVGAPAASATQYQRTMIEEFGSVEKPNLTAGTTVAVDQASGDVLVSTDGGKILRFDADGTAAPFTALGSNEIDGQMGPGEKPCAEEPASCDQTPQNGLEFFLGKTQIAIDNSGATTNGDIYVVVTGGGVKAVDIFSSEGKYLGQITAKNFEPLAYPAGVAVDPSGSVYISDLGGISEFAPTANPPVNTDYINTFQKPPFVKENISGLQMGAGPTAGLMFFAYQGESNNESPEDAVGVGELNLSDGEFGTFAHGYGLTSFRALLGVDPTSGNPLALQTNYDSIEEGALRSREVVEFAGGGGDGTVGSVQSRLIDEQAGIESIALGSAGQVYLLDEEALLVYGEPKVTPTVEVNLPANVTGKAAVLTGTVNPSGLEIDDCYFEYGPSSSFKEPANNLTIPCANFAPGAIPPDSNPHAVHASISGLNPDGEEYKVRLVAANENGTERGTPRAFSTAHTVGTEAATDVGLTTATLHGKVLPEGLEYSECFFEWGLNEKAYEHQAACNPAAAAIDPTAAAQSVTAALTGLQRNSVYHFRLVGTNSEGTQVGEELTLTTLGLPQLTEVRASDATQSAVTLEAKVNPSGAGTSYRFEWGTGTGYGNKVPINYEPFIGSGTEPVLVKAELSGLSSATRYHYRVIASNSSGTERSSDQVLETLNSCVVAGAGIAGLPDGRCFELASPSDAGPVAIPGEARAAAEMGPQVATSGAGAVAYSVISGFPTATSGADVLYMSQRTGSSWTYPTQLKPPINAADEREGGAGSGPVLALNGSLSCEIAESFMPLTKDPGPLENREDGGSSLYRRQTSGDAWEAITKLPPQTGPISGYYVNGMSENCDTVVFTTPAVYPGLPGEDYGLERQRLYEWQDGALVSLGVVPGPSGAAATEANETGGPRNVVSESGSRVFFNATRRASPNPAEIGAQGVFVRAADGQVTDISLSQTATPDTGATFQWATRDGSVAFFTANTGLAGQGSAGGTDLYEYDLASEALTDLTVAAESEVAEVEGFVGGADNGSRVYFIARGKLLAGKGRGKTAAENTAAATTNLYSEAGGALSFVATIGANEAVQIGYGLQGYVGSTSNVTPDGRYLVFKTKKRVTAYENAGKPEAYLYDASLGSKGMVCVSCRQDGLPPAGTVLEIGSSSRSRVNSVIAERGSDVEVFFVSVDQLAPGAVEGEASLYEWSHNQVFRIVSEIPDQMEPASGYNRLNNIGVSTDGTNMYFSTTQTLTWNDGDRRSSVYDARIGGGFPEPSTGSPPCVPTTEGSCQGAPGAITTAPAASSATFTGPGNPQSASHKKKHEKKHKKKHRKGKHGKKAGGKKSQAKRQADSDRRAGK